MRQLRYWLVEVDNCLKAFVRHSQEYDAKTKDLHTSIWVRGKALYVRASGGNWKLLSYKGTASVISDHMGVQRYAVHMYPVSLKQWGV